MVLTGALERLRQARQYRVSFVLSRRLMNCESGLVVLHFSQYWPSRGRSGISGGWCPSGSGGLGGGGPDGPGATVAISGVGNAANINSKDRG